MKTLIKNVNILTMTDKEYYNATLVIEDDHIKSINEIEEVDEVIDARGGILLPGFINLHTHLAMTPFRGLGDDIPDRLRRFLFPLESKCVDENLVYHATKYSIAESLLSGVTTTVDMYYFPKAMAKACKEMNIRSFVGETIIDEVSIDKASSKEALTDLEELLKENDDLVKYFVAPHATNTCSLDTLVNAKELANKYDTLFSLHASEMTYEIDYFKDTYQMSPIEFLANNKLLDKRTILAHLILINSKDIELLKVNNASAAHCLVSNLKAAKGVMPLKEMLNKGINVGLGTDGPSSGNTLDLFTSLKMIACVHKTVNKDRSSFPCKEILKLATINGAKALGLDDILGTIEVGKKADFMILETESVNMYPLHDLYSTICYSANSSNVDTVFVNGKCLVKDKKLVNENLNILRNNLEEASRFFNETIKTL